MLKTAIKATLKAGEISLEFFNKDKNIFYKKQEEITTDVDIKAERAIKKIIKEKFPQHSILGEEEGEDNIGKSEYLWIIDPLDGTLNYTRGLNLYGISIALAKNKNVILGVVYNPITKELFTAEKDKGAFLNDKTITPSRIKDLKKSILYSTELYKTKNIVNCLYDEIKDFRITSSSAYETCLVACGKIDGFIKVTSHPWGFAAAGLIVEEAGGRVTNFDGTNWNIDSKKLIITNQNLYEKIFNKLKNK